MKFLGSSVFWSIADDVLLSPEHLKAAGFEKEIPRNEPKTALIKACKVVKKGWEIKDADIGARAATPKTLKKGDHRRFHDSAIECRIALTRPKITDDGFTTETAMTITLKKGEATLSFEIGALSATEFRDLSTRIMQAYEEARGTIDATQFRLLVAKKVTGFCRGITLRAFSGGIYLVPEVHTERLKKVRELFKGLDKKKAVFEALPIYDDGSETAANLSYHVATAMEREIKKFVAALTKESKEGMSKRTLETRAEAAADIKAMIKDFDEHLKKKADDFRARTDRMIGLLEVKLADAKGKTVEPFDLEAELSALDAVVEVERLERLGARS